MPNIGNRYDKLMKNIRKVAIYNIENSKLCICDMKIMSRRNGDDSVNNESAGRVFTESPPFLSDIVFISQKHSLLFRILYTFHLCFKKKKKKKRRKKKSFNDPHPPSPDYPNDKTVCSNNYLATPTWHVKARHALRRTTTTCTRSEFLGF